LITTHSTEAVGSVETSLVDVNQMILDEKLWYAKEMFKLHNKQDYILVQKMLKTQFDDFDGVNVMDAVYNESQQVGYPTNDPSFVGLNQFANRGASWNVSNSDRAIRDIPYFINTANWKAILSLRNGIDLNSVDKKMTPDVINTVQRLVTNLNSPIYQAIFEGEIYGFVGALIVIDGQDTVGDLEEPIDYEIKKGQFMGLKLLTRLYSIVPETNELIGISDIRDAKYWGHANLIGKPKYYRINLDQENATQKGIRVHASRILTYNTNPLSYVESKLELNMGISMWERVYSEMGRFETLMGQTIKMAQRANVPVLKTDDSSMTLATLNSREALSMMLTKMKLMKMALTNSNMVSIGKDDAFEFANASFQDVHNVIDKVTEHLSSALNAPSSVTHGRKIEKDEEKAFEWVIKKIQEYNLRDWYRRLIPLVYRNEYGEDIPAFDFNFKGVFLPTEQEKANTFKLLSEIISDLYDRNIVTVDEARNMVSVAMTNISDIGQVFSGVYNKWVEGDNIIDEKIKNKINMDIALAKITNTGSPDPRTEKGKEIGGDPSTKKKPTPTIKGEKE
jgi:hypothetical protein